MWPLDLGVVIATLSLLVALTGALMSRRALRRAGYRTSADLVLEADRVFLTWPELRQYFYDGQECPPADDPLHPRVLAAAELMLDILEAIWDQRHEFAASDRAAWREWMHDLLEWSPTMRQLYEAQPEWFPTLHDMMAWEDCDRPDEHPWAARQPGPTGDGRSFRVRRVARRAPLIGAHIHR